MSVSNNTDYFQVSVLSLCRLLFVNIPSNRESRQEINPYHLSYRFKRVEILDSVQTNLNVQSWFRY